MCYEVSCGPSVFRYGMAERDMEAAAEYEAGLNAKFDDLSRDIQAEANLAHEEMAALERRVEELERLVSWLMADRDRREEDDCK